MNSWIIIDGIRSWIFQEKVRKGREDEEMSKVVIRYLCQEGSTWYSCIVLNTKYKYTVKYKEVLQH